MPTYRIYLVQRRGTVVPHGEFASETDTAALAKLAELARPNAESELWEGDRYVGRVPERFPEARR